MKFFITTFLIVFLLWSPSTQAKTVIKLESSSDDMTPVIRKILEDIKDKDIKLVFQKGTYKFLPDYAITKYCYITNHGNGLKNVIFPFDWFNSVEIEGNNSEFVFHGQVAPFQFENCKSVKISNLTIDWDIPFTFLCEVVDINKKDGWRDVRPFTDGFSWKLHKGQLLFPNVDGFNYSSLGSTLAFDAEHKRVVHGAQDMHSNPRWVEKRNDGILRIHEPLKHYPPVGSLLSSKGDRAHDRYAPAFHIKSSNNIHFEGVVIHHALGMGFLMERADNATLLNCGVYLRKGSNRVISSTADATHFCNCKGDILIENCRFENMLDDGTNVHGTYMAIDEIIDKNTLRLGFGHFEQMGFKFAEPGDEMWFIHQPSSQRASENVVAAVRVVNDRFIELQFENKLPSQTTKGDILENKTWNPVFTMRGCTIGNHRARNVVLKTPLKTVIEDNDFSSMMSSIFFRGETFFWFESGAVNDVLIRNNRFNYCAYSNMEHAVLYITPRLGKVFDKNELYDRNIRFENNTIETFDSRIVWADRVDGLLIKNNTIRKTDMAKTLHPDGAIFDINNCKNVKIVGNTYSGESKNAFNIDTKSKTTLKIEQNKGF